MAFTNINYKSKNLSIHKSVSKPKFNEKTVLVTSTWDYVDLWLKRAGKREARFYWNQAHSFFDATKMLPNTSAPLTAYYCFLNATKALLLTKGIQFSDKHGVSGFTIQGQTSLNNEKVKFQSDGILPALCQHLGESSNAEIYTLKDLLYNIPNIHRAFDLTYSSDSEIFIPIKNPKIVRSDTTSESWFYCELDDKFANQHTVNKLPDTFERDRGITDKFVIRSKKRFSWKLNNKKASILRYTTFHKKLRQNLYYINGKDTLWYIKRNEINDKIIHRSTMTITFAAMHKLSEMARYTPDVLFKHFDCQHNWLLSEFISSAPSQFIDEISSELTGQEFISPLKY